MLGLFLLKYVLPNCTGSNQMFWELKIVNIFEDLLLLNLTLAISNTFLNSKELYRLQS